MTTDTTLCPSFPGAFEERSTVGTKSAVVPSPSAAMSWFKNLTWVLWMALATLCIHWQETCYRVAEGVYQIPGLDAKLFPSLESYWSFQTHLWLQPSYALAGLGFFYGFRIEKNNPKKTFLTVWAVFICMIVLSRIIISTVHAGEAINAEIVTGLVLIVYGLFLTTQQLSFRRENRSLMYAGISAGLAMSGGVLAATHNAEIVALAEAFRPGFWLLWLLLAASLVAAQENFARKSEFTRFFPVWITWKKSPRIHIVKQLQESMWLVFLPVSFILNMGLFYGYREAVPSFMFAWAVYTVYDVVLRVINNRILGEPFYLIHALGMTLVVLGTWLTYLGGAS